MYLTEFLEVVVVGPVVLGGDELFCPPLALSYLGKMQSKAVVLTQIKGEFAVRVHHAIEQDRGIIDASGNVDAEGVIAVWYRRVGVDHLVISV